MAGKYSVELNNLLDNNSHGSILRNIRPGSYVLECGCAQGYMTRYMKEKLQCKVSIIEYNEEDFQIAIEYAEDGICANLEEDAWCDYYAGKKFDVILFADVLEHLRNPQEVLNRSVTLLKDDGMIVASIPNVGHHDILINLMNNRWNYKPLGLLDNTHIHFWAEKNLEELFKDAGLDIIKKDYTIGGAYCTEQSNTDDPAEVLPAINVICHRKFGDVYQFVYYTQKTQYVTEHSILCEDFYEKRHASFGSIPQICNDYQRKLDADYAEYKRIKTENQEQKEQLSDIQQELQVYKKEYVIALNHIDDLRRHITGIEELYNSICSSVFWKITKPLRWTAEMIMKIPPVRAAVNLCQYLKINGYHKTIEYIHNKLIYHLDFSSAAWPHYSQDQLDMQRNERFSKNVRISVLVPLYNTPKEYLKDMIASVRDQTYSNWELCLADGSDDQHSYIAWICRWHAFRDHRIHYKKLQQNFGISGNTNACIEMATGDYIALFDHDDLLHPAALYETMKAICDKDADFIYTDEIKFHEKPADAFCPHFKSDYAPDSLRGINYICHLTVFKRNLLDKAGLFRLECDGSQDYDMILRLTEQAHSIVHIAKVLYYWRAHESSVAEKVSAKPYVMEAAHRALRDHLERIGLKGEVTDARASTIYRIRYTLTSTPLVSIIIPNYEHKQELEDCLNSIFGKTTYPNFEILIIENNSKCKEIFDYYEAIQKKWKNVRVVVWEGIFNYSAINNFGVNFANGEQLILLNNDVKVITPDWIQEMLMFSQRSDVGAVGAMLYYPDDTIQHAGVILGIGGVAGHSHKYFPRDDLGYMGRLVYAQNLTAVTAACLMLRRSVWDEVGGLDELFEVAFNDVDFCMRIRKKGYLIVWTPFAELYHCESKSRGLDDSPKKRRRYMSEVHRFQDRWAKELADGDPYYNPNLSQIKEDFSLKE